jgi:hypothetical protein
MAMADLRAAHPGEERLRSIGAGLIEGMGFFAIDAANLKALT